MKKLKDLAPHEKEILSSEFLKEELIQQRLADVVAHSWRKHNEKIFDNLGGLEGIKSICKQLKEHGLTPEQAKEMTPEEFGNFLEEHDIIIKEKGIQLKVEKVEKPKHPTYKVGDIIRIGDNDE